MTSKWNKVIRIRTLYTFPLWLSSSNFQDDLIFISQSPFLGVSGTILKYLNTQLLYAVKIFSKHDMLAILVDDLEIHAWLNSLIIESIYTFPLINKAVWCRLAGQSCLIPARHEQVKMWNKGFSPDSAKNLLKDFRQDN